MYTTLKVKVEECEKEDPLEMNAVFAGMSLLFGKGHLFTMNDEAMALFSGYHDNEVLDFRKNELFEDAKSMVMSKSIGNVLRIAGIQAALRTSLETTLLLPDDVFDINSAVINGEDMRRALELVSYSVKCHFSILETTQRRGVKRSLVLEMPDPASNDTDFLLLHRLKIQKLFGSAVNNEIAICKITKDHLYPQIGSNSSGQDARKFLGALQIHGLGRLEDNERKFVLFDRENVTSPEKVELFKKLGVY